MHKDLTGSGLDVHSQKCKKCEFATHSEGLLRRHNTLIHEIKETKLNIMLGFEIDMQKYEKLLECMGEGSTKYECDECSDSNHSDGKLTLHKLTTHQG